MKMTITSIHLRSPFKFFPLSLYALHIVRQLKSSNCIEFKKRGFGRTHYTMTLWKSEEDLKAFAASGAHREAMQKGLPDWKTAKQMLLQQGHLIEYK